MRKCGRFDHHWLSIALEKESSRLQTRLPAQGANGNGDLTLKARAILPDREPDRIAADAKPRNDEPTEAEIKLAREVLSGMATTNPDVRAFGEAYRAKGGKASNAKLGKLLRLLREN